MTFPHLITSSGNDSTDRILQALVGMFETVFPNRIRGYFVEGSVADQTAIATSDIDLVILFKDAFNGAQERHKAEQLATFYDYAVHLELDIEILDEEAIAKGVPPSLKLASSQLFGDPISDQFPLITMADWGRERTHAAYWLMTKVFNRSEKVILPRDYPLPDAEFYGYAERIVRLDDGRRVKSTRDLIRVIGWAGTALIALQAGKIVTRKKDCHLLYRQYIADEWSSLFESIYRKCRQEWHYLTPPNKVEREELTEICQLTLQFENYFLTVYKSFLLGELYGADNAAIKHALTIQKAIPFIDQDVSNAIQQLTATTNKEISLLAQSVIKSHYS